MKTVILGAGPSGLGVALGLLELGHRNLVLVEKCPTVGGLSGSFKIGDTVLDYGPHRFSPEYPDLIQRIRELLGDELLEVSNEHAVVFKNHVYRYPPVITDFINLSAIATSTKVVLSFFAERVKKALHKLQGHAQAPDTFESIIVERFGKALYQEVVLPMSLKVWGDPSTLDPEFANLRFAVPTIVAWWKKLIHRSNEFNDKSFYYPRQGFQQLWDRMADHLRDNGVEIFCSASATAVHLEEDRVSSVELTQGGRTIHLDVDWLVSTIPTQHFVRLLKPNPFTPAELLANKFRNRGMILAYFLVDRPRSLPARVVIFPEGKYAFNRLSEQNQFSRETVIEGHSAVLADILADVDSETWNLADSVLTERMLNQIEECGFFKKADVREHKIIRVPIAYPLPTIEREAEQKRFNKVLMKYHNLLCTGRFASSDYNNSHTALKKGLMAADTIHKQYRADQWYPLADTIRKTAIRD